MNRLLYSSLGLLFCLLVASPAFAEAPMGEKAPYQNNRENLNNTVEQNHRDRKQSAPSVLDLNRDSQASNLLTLSEFPTSNTQKYQLDTNPRNALGVNLDPIPTSTGKIEQSLSMAPSTELQRNTNFRWNVSNDLSLGVGTVDKFDPVRSRRPFDSSDNFFGPEVPQTTVNNNWRVNLNFQPFSALGINFNGNDLSSQFGINWQPVSGLTFTGTRNNQNESFAGGVQISQKFQNFGFSAQANLDTEERWRWGVSSNLDDLQLSYQRNGSQNEEGMNSQASYRILQGDRASSALKLGYETRESESRDTRLTTFGWQFRSGNGANDGQGFWEFDLGYGIGTQGEGLITSVATKLTPGLKLRAQFQQISVSSDSDTFKLELLPFSK
jgi:hypothetical protein